MQTTTTFTPPAGSPLAPILSALTALVVSMENVTAPTPAATAFHKAIRRKGEELVQAGGIEAIDYALAIIRDQAPEKADAREAILEAAWAGLPGWRS